jgi:hypothetical protein
MNETYWLAGSNIENQMDAPAAIQQLLAASSIKPRWVQAAHWIGSKECCQNLAEETCAHLPDMPTPFCWTEAPLLDHLLLQNLIRSIMLDEIELVLIGQTNAQGTAVMLLSSPQAVGRYNILPAVRMESCRAFPDKLETAFAKGIPTTQRFNANAGDVVWQMNSLVQTMLASKKSGGLLQSRASQQGRSVKRPSRRGTLAIRIELV